MILKEILHELREIRKELQIIRNDKEFNEFVPEDSNGTYNKRSHICAGFSQKSFH